MKKWIAFVCTMACMLVFWACDGEKQPVLETEPTKDYSQIPGAVQHLVDMWDNTKEEQIFCEPGLEKFYEDESAEYYFDCHKSQHVWAMDNRGRIVDIVTALQEGWATVESLDKYGLVILQNRKLHNGYCPWERSCGLFLRKPLT